MARQPQSIVNYKNVAYTLSLFALSPPFVA